MAATKIIVIHKNLSQCLDYTMNPDKTDTAGDLANVLEYTQNAEKTEQRLFVSGVNCDPFHASTIMQRTKQRWGKDGGNRVQAYHIIQSFAPGETTPQQAHKIGCELVEKLFGERYEATVSTHLDKAHLHNHIVVNSVSFVDGKMYRDTRSNYYKGIRGTSDQLCREHGLSVIEVVENTHQNYAEWMGKDTMRNIVRRDIDEVIESTFGWSTFYADLKKRGYSIQAGPNRRYTTVRPPNGKRNIRLDKLGQGYTEQDIKERLWQKQAVEYSPWAQPTIQRYTAPPRQPKPRVEHWRYAGTFPVHHKVKGFMAGYYHYLYLLRRTKQKRTSKRCYYLLKEEFQKFDRYCEQARLIWDNHIETKQDLMDLQAAQEAVLSDLEKQRKPLYRKKSACSGEERSAIEEQITELNEQIAECRRVLRVCGNIQKDAERIQEQTRKAREAELQSRTKEKRRTKQWTR